MTKSKMTGEGIVSNVVRKSATVGKALLFSIVVVAFFCALGLFVAVGLIIDAAES